MYQFEDEKNPDIKLGGFLLFLKPVLCCPCLFCPSDTFEHCLALPTRWRASLCAIFYGYLLCDQRRCDNSIKVCAPRRVSASGAPHIVTWTKQTWIKHHNTQFSYNQDQTRLLLSQPFTMFDPSLTGSWFVIYGILIQYLLFEIQLHTYADIKENIVCILPAYFLWAKKIQYIHS